MLILVTLLSSESDVLPSLFNITDRPPVRIGIAVGPRTWFGDQYGNNISQSGTVLNNRFTGAFSYAMGVSSAFNFTIENNSLFGNTSFIGANGPNCSTEETVPTPAAFVIDTNNTQSMTVQSEFETVPSGDGLTCVLPPDGGDYWPFGGNPDPNVPPVSPSEPNSSGNTGRGKGGLTTGQKVGIALGVILGVLFVALVTWLIQRWAARRSTNRPTNSSRRTGSMHKSQLN